MKEDLQQRSAKLESVLAQLSKQLQQLNKKVEDSQKQWSELQTLHSSITATRPSSQDTVIYQEELDTARQSGLLDMTILNSEKSIKEIFNQVNSAVYNQMQCFKGLNSGSLADSLGEYRRLLTQIVLENPQLKFVTAHDLSTATKDVQTSYCQIRHDVDADIVACLPMAEIEAELGIQSTYFLLHTAAYFGNWEVDEEKHKAVFKRHEALADYYLQIQELGHEIAVHTDPMHLYQSLNVDGAQALCSDIEWLRSRGIKVSGTAPHNNPDEYGASNSAIFRGRPVNYLQQSGAAGVIKNGKWAPLALLDESQLGLSYEADDVNSPVHGMALDYISPTSKDMWYRFFKTSDIMDWETKRHSGDDRYDDFSGEHYCKLFPDLYTSEKDLWLNSSSISATFSQRAPKIIVLSIHPEHFGYRDRPDGLPHI